MSSLSALLGSSDAVSRIERIAGETRFGGRLDAFEFATMPRRKGPTPAGADAVPNGPVMLGPSGSYGVLVDYAGHGVCLDYSVPRPMAMGAHWHSFTETLIGLAGSVRITTLRRSEPASSRLIVAGDRLDLDPMVPHRADVDVSARFLVVFGSACVFSVNGESLCAAELRQRGLVPRVGSASDEHGRDGPSSDGHSSDGVGHA